MKASAFDYKAEEAENAKRREEWAKQWFLVSNDEETQIVHGAAAAKMLYEGGKWTSRAPGGDSEASCREKCSIPNEPCRECGRIFSTSYCEPIKSEMLADNICFNCHFWRGYFRTKDNPRIARIGGQHYFANPNKGGDTRWNGFGGRVSSIRWNDGREVTTNDLWAQGTIPPIWRERLPDNAEFVNLRSAATEQTEPTPHGHESK